MRRFVWVEHIAGEYRDGVQKCNRCGAIVTDNRSVAYQIEHGPPGHWNPGPLYRGGTCPEVTVTSRPDRPEDEIVQCGGDA